MSEKYDNEVGDAATVLAFRLDERQPQQLADKDVERHVIWATTDIVMGDLLDELNEHACYSLDDYVHRLPEPTKELAKDVFTKATILLVDSGAEVKTNPLPEGLSKNLWQEALQNLQAIRRSLAKHDDPNLGSYWAGLPNAHERAAMINYLREAAELVAETNK